VRRLPIWITLVCACGGAAAAPKPVALATPRSHARTLAERKATACGREHLVPVAAPWVASADSASSAAMSGVVGQVSVVDGKGGRVDVDADVLNPVRIGARLTLDDTRESARRLWKTGKFDDITIDTEPSSGRRIAVVFRVALRRLIGEVFTNNTETDALHLSTGVVYDPVAIVSAGMAFAHSFAQQGYPDFALSLTSDFSDDTHRTVDVCIRFDRGSKVTLEAIDVRGSAYVGPLSALLAREDTANVRGNVIDEAVLERDPLVMSAWLYDHGLLEHKIQQSLERQSDVVTVVFQVTDGPVYRYGSFDVRGDLLAPKPDYMKLVTEKRGDVFNRTATLKIIADIKALNGTLGHSDTDVEPNVEMDAAKHTVALVFTVRAPHVHP